MIWRCELNNFIELVGYSVYRKNTLLEANTPNAPSALVLTEHKELIPLNLIPKTATNEVKEARSVDYSFAMWDFNADKDGNYLFDRVLDFGTITSETIIKFKLRNADTKDRILRNVVFSKNDNIDIFGISTGKVFKPNESVEITLKTDINGEAVINMELNFIFDGQIITFTLMGVRAVVWSYLPNLAYTESKELKTDIFTAQNGTEKRVSIRDKFIRSVKFRLTTDEIAKQKGILNLLSYAQKASFFVPLWLSSVVCENDYNTASNIQTTDTINSEFKIGGFVLLYRDFDRYDFVKLTNLTRKSVSNQKVFNPKTGKASKTTAYKGIFSFEKVVNLQKGDLIVPLITATPKTAINSDFMTGKVGSYNLEFKELL